MAFSLLLPATQAAGSELMLCREPATARRAAYEQELVLPDGSPARLLIADRVFPEDAACRRLPLAVPAADVLWVGLVPSEEASVLGDKFALQGSEAGGRFAVSEIIPGGEAPPAAPDGGPAGFSARPFGAEERAGFDGRRLRCRAGRAPAGLLLQPRAAWPGHGPAVLRVKARGSGRFAFALADAGRLQSQAPLELGSADLAAQAREMAFPVPTNAGDWMAVAIVCPASAATLELMSLSLTPPMPARPVPRAAWIWSPAAWSEAPEAIWSLQERHDVRKIYITVPTAGGKVAAPGRLAAFVAAARRRGLEVWAVSGDPRDVLPSSHPALMARMRAYADYNRDAGPAAGLAGVQLDIEPYLLPGYRLAPDAWRERYAAAAAKARSALAPSLPLDLVMPAWWAGNRHWGEALLAALVPLDISVTVMNYRTDARSLMDDARPFLEWSSRHRRPLTMALEMGPIADEVSRHYRRSADGGELWALPWNGETALLLLRAPASGLPGRSYRLTHAAVAPGSRISFRGDGERLAATLAEVLPAWAAWPHFAGIAIHGLDAPAAPEPRGAADGQKDERQTSEAGKP